MNCSSRSSTSRATSSAMPPRWNRMCGISFSVTHACGGAGAAGTSNERPGKAKARHIPSSGGTQSSQCCETEHPSLSEAPARSPVCLITHSRACAVNKNHITPLHTGHFKRKNVWRHGEKLNVQRARLSAGHSLSLSLSPPPHTRPSYIVGILVRRRQ